jgi:DNA-directed RNA polymerase II subunit RPB3
MSKQIYFENVSYPYSNTWDKSKHYVQFQLHDVHFSLANALRRCMISQVKTIGFRTEPFENSTVKIIHNDSPLHNQFLEHRIGMIPVNIKKPEEFDLDEYSFEIDETNDTSEIKYITTKDIKVKRIANNSYLSDSECRKMFPPDPITGDYLILTLLRPHYYTSISKSINEMNQISKNFDKKIEKSVSLKVEATVVCSNGEENGHFNPTSCATYFNTVDEEKAKIAENEYIEKQNEQNKLNELTLDDPEKLRRRFQISEQARYFYTDDEGEPNHFTFRIESVGVIPPLVVFHKSLNVMIAKLNLLISNIVSQNSNYINISPSQQIPDGIDLLIKEEDDTIGNIVQSYLTKNFCHYGSNNKLNFIGYKKPHPLEYQIIFTLQGNCNDLIGEVFIPGCKDIIKLLSKIQKNVEDHKGFMVESKKLV